MRFIKHLTTWLLLLTVLTASGLVSAKVASGSQNLSGGLHQAESGFNSLIRLAKIDFNYDAASGSSVVRKSAGNRFPKNADDLLSDLPRDAKGRIHPSSKVRIRPEQHSLKPGETYAPRHHGQHYHVETRVDPTKSWNNKRNVTKIKPPGYKPGQGTGFLPGEKFPGTN